MNRLNINYNFIVVASKKPQKLTEGIEFRTDAVWLNELTKYLNESQVFLDLIRHGHNGLSFRVFEAMAFQKKLITTNTSIKNYDFYNPNNIMVIDADNPVIDPAFFDTPYEPLSESIYNKYTIQSWVKTVFGI